MGFGRSAYDSRMFRGRSAERPYVGRSVDLPTEPFLDFAGIVGDLGRAADSQRASAYEYAAAVAAGRKVIVDNAALQVDGPILYVNGAAPSGLAILDCAAFDIHRAILQIHGAAVLLRPLCHSATPTLHTAPLRRAARKAPPKTG